MKLSYLNRLCFLLTTSLLLAGCKDIEPVEITSAKIFFYRKDGADVATQPSLITKSLTQNQVQWVQCWLEANRAGWSKHNPMASLLPQWCLELASTSGKAYGLCRYDANAVLRGLGAEMERPLTEQDKVLFMQLIENTN